MSATALAVTPTPERVDIEKIYAISYEDEPAANARDAEDKKTAGLFNEAGVIPPPYQIEDLVRRVEESSILRQCFDTMATNCDQFGYRLVPVIDLQAKDADQRIADAMLLERLWHQDLGAGAVTQKAAAGTPDNPTTKPAISWPIRSAIRPSSPTPFNHRDFRLRSD